VLLDSQVDFDIIPEDYLANCTVDRKRLVLNQEDYHVFIVPQATMLPRAVVDKLHSFAVQGLPVWCIGSKPTHTCEGEPIPQEMLAQFELIKLDKLPAAIRFRGFADVTAVGENTKWLRVYHYSRNGGHVVMLTNEGIHGPVNAKLRLRDFKGGDFVRYDPMENKAVRDTAKRQIEISLPVYGSEMLFFGDIDMEGIFPAERKNWAALALKAPSWKVSYAAAEDFVPGEACPDAFGEEETVTKLFNVIRKKKKFAGFVRYETEFTAPGEGMDRREYGLDLGQVGEVAYVWVDGQSAGERIIPPYRFRFTAIPGQKVKLCVVTTSHLGYAMQDHFSAYVPFEPVGLMGPVVLEG